MAERAPIGVPPHIGNRLSLDLINLEKLPVSRDGTSISIVADCAFKYETIGHFLLGDKDGSIVQSTTKRCHSNCEDCLRAIFRDWLQNGKDRSWKRLLECLEWCNLSSVAERIQKNLQEFTQEGATGITATVAGRKRSLESSSSGSHTDLGMALNRANIMKVKSEFANLMLFTLKKLEEKKVDPSQLYLWLLSFFPSNGAQLPKSDEICTMFEDITRHNMWNWYEWDLLVEISERFLHEDKEARAKIGVYSEVLAAYKATTEIAEMIKNKHLAVEDTPSAKRMRYDSSNYCKLEVQLQHLNPTEVMVKYIDTLWERLRVQFQLPPLHILLDHLEGNSIEIAWLIPAQYKEQIVKVATLSEEFFQENMITLIVVNGKCVYSEPHVSSSCKSPSNGQHDLGPSAPPAQVTETEECGGYVCEFLSLPDENVQTRCGICLLIIRKPYEVTCCGKLFCESCIIREMREKRGCPNCKKEDYGASLSKSNERYLNQQKVSCAHCADGCKWKGELGKHDKHLNQTADLEQKIDGCFYARLNCRFECGTTLPRFKILYHEMYECTKQVKDLNPREELFLRKIHELFQELIQRDTREKSASSTATQPSEYNPEGATAVVSVQHQIEVQHTSSNPAVVPVEYTIDSFTDRMNYGRDYVSEPFYTHPKGYKMCVWVHPKGYGTAENTHVSVFICFVKGEYDDKLKWPFRGTITVQLLNQANDRDHREHIITYDKSNSYYGRKVVTEEKSKGFGVFEAMSHETLKDTKYCQYVKDDCLKIRICKVLMPPKKRMFSL